ncbi:MAG: NAD(P)/FAD-dependent oxidoreductase [Eubacteriales bacterium]|nr:NAD(P)/FAD-dependent oxidoreductase [Eubacteriales bacterium]
MADKIAVVGGGAAGLMAAGRLRELKCDVTLFEKMNRCALKVGITGKGRCNVTNNCSAADFIANVTTNPRFLMSAAHTFPPSEVMRFFEERGVRLKTERGNRVFPESDRASDIAGALRRYASCGVIHEAVTGIAVSDGAVRAVITSKGAYPFDRIIICTGGCSYPKTGSDGDGYRFARSAGHTIIKPRPSLVPIETEERWCAELQGLSLRNVSAELIETESKKTVYSEFGELLFTHFGLSGPIILSMSAHIKPGKPYKIVINLKPALDEAALDARLLSDFAKYSNRDFANALGDLLPVKLIPVIVNLSGIDGRRKVNLITRVQRQTLLSLLRSLTLTFRAFRPIEEAVVTSGGVAVNEINPKTMESKLMRGLYFAGEVIDVDAYTGGYNLQIAFCTARAAAQAAAGISNR